MSTPDDRREPGPRSATEDEFGVEQSLIGALGRAAWQFLLAAGLASMVLGLIILVWPSETLRVAGILFGIYLLVSGIVQVVSAFGEHVPTGMRVLAIIVGALSILLGLICFRGAFESVLLLGIWIGIGFLLRGVAVTVAAASGPAIPGRGWAIFMGVLVGLAGIIMITWPIASVATLTIFAGWWLLVIGVVEIVHSFQLRKAVLSH